MDAEIIEFHKPFGNKKNVYISNILTCGSVDIGKLESCLHQIFSKYGLIFEVQVFKGTQNPSNTLQCLSSSAKLCHGASGPRNGSAFATSATSSSDKSYRSNHESTNLFSCQCDDATTHTTTGYFGFVKFYSTRDAQRAKKSLHLTHFLGLQNCKVSFAQRKKDHEKWPLSVSQCSTLANHYLGFNGWSTHVRVLSRQEPDPPGETSEWACQFLCVLDLVLPRHGLMTSGVGVNRETCSVTEPWAKGPTLSLCRKRAVQYACQAAFSRLLIVTLASGRVWPEVNTVDDDPTQRVLDELDDAGLMKVNELSTEPKSEDNDSSDEDDNIDVLLQLMQEGQDPP